MKRLARGFTLMELMVAIAVFSVLAAMAYGGLQSVLKTDRTLEQATGRLRELQEAMLFITRDMAQLDGRGIRDETGNQQPPFLTKSDSLVALEFTRGGWSNPAGQARSTLQRVGYGVDAKQLIRYSWPTLDRAPDTTPQRIQLLDKVVSMHMRFMDDKNAWQEQWPPQQTDPTVPPALPHAVEFTIELEDLGTIRRLFAVDASIVQIIPPGTSGKVNETSHDKTK